MGFNERLSASDDVASVRLIDRHSRSFAGSNPVTATPTATVVPAIQIASAVVTAAGVGAAVGDYID